MFSTTCYVDVNLALIHLYDVMYCAFVEMYFIILSSTSCVYVAICIVVHSRRVFLFLLSEASSNLQRRILNG
ncbi:MAG: hypothetical protein FD143_3638 [Ignavibacteria bacterium]|nr:MAG: hypothetical protein FD143_3638 [Ignavibacteria bacterium]